MPIENINITDVAKASDLSAHEARVDNPHSVTKTQVGLSNVDNTSDASKPLSSAATTALAGKEPTIVATTSADYYRGDKSFQPLNKAAVGLSNVDNTSDVNKPVSTAQQTALDNKVDKISGKGLSTEDYTTTEKNKLSGIASGATVNSSDATLLARANHTGTQAISTVIGLQVALDAKQTRENWMQLTQVNTFRAMFNY